MMGELESLALSIAVRERSAAEVTQEALDRIASRHDLNSFVSVDETAALQQANEIDQLLSRGVDVGPLAGIPFGVKDLDHVVGFRTARGSRWFAGSPIASRDDIHVARLRAAGAIPIGKTTTPEFGSAAFTSSDIQGVTRNPWDLTRTPGGSSGGTAAAVSAGLVPFGTASDGGGSIRAPAGFCGLPGLRPSYGRVATYASTHVAQNAVNFALARTVADTALLLDICAGPDPCDRTSLPSPTTNYRVATDTLDVEGLRVAYSPCFGFGPIESAVGQLVEKALAVLVRSADLELVEADLALPFYFDTYSKIEGVDRWVDLPDDLWPDRKDELSSALQPEWESGARARLPQLAAVFSDRRRLEHRVASIFESVDVVITPTTGITAFAAEGPVPGEIDGETIHPFVAVAQPILASLCNLPAISIPAGVTDTGLPVGLQIIGRRHREDICLRLGQLLEAEVGTFSPPSDMGPFAAASPG